ncbi:MAG: GGDEF domain-containing protein [Desulfovibrionaceae bacterium]|nr:GGDEF domain-containing protein [Desulfovibrionaceae bacterium]
MTRTVDKYMVQRQAPSRLRRMIQGGVLGLGAPLGWIFLERALSLHRLVPPSYQLSLFAYMCLGTMTVFAAFGYVLGKAEENFAHLSMVDDLTGLFNTRMFHVTFDREFANALRYKSSLGLAIIDLDHFKRVNDTYGHKAGDAVLAAVAHTITVQVREGDIVARIGGEEIAVIMPQTDCHGGRVLAERIWRAISATEVPLDDGRILHINASIGVACTDAFPAKVPHGLFVLADRAMYHAKQTGRNKVVMIQEVPGIGVDQDTPVECRVKE